MTTDWEQQKEQTVATLTPVIEKMIEVQTERAKDPGCTGWHSHLQMFYARNHYAREGKNTDGIVLCPVHRNDGKGAGGAVLHPVNPA